MRIGMIIGCGALLALTPAQAQISGGAGTGTGAGSATSTGVGTGRVSGVGPSTLGSASTSVGATGNRLPGASGSTLPADRARRSGSTLSSLVPSQGAARTGLLGGESYERPGVPGRPRPAPLASGGVSTGSAGQARSQGGTDGNYAYEDTLRQAGDAARGDGTAPSASSTAASEAASRP